MLGIDLPVEAEKILADMARATGRSEEEIARKAVLECLEDWEDALIADERMADEGPNTPLEEVIRKLELREAEENRNKPAAE